MRTTLRCPNPLSVDRGTPGSDVGGPFSCTIALAYQCKLLYKGVWHGVQQMAYLTEDEIERRAERIMNVIDRSYMRGEITAEMYDMLVKDIDQWVQEQLKQIKVIR